MIWTCYLLCSLLLVAGGCTATGTSTPADPAAEEVRAIAKEEAIQVADQWLTRHEARYHGTDTPLPPGEEEPPEPTPPGPPPQQPSGDCYDPAFPLVKEGRCLECGGHVWSTRTLSSGNRFARCASGVLEVTPANGTGTVLGEPSPARGWQAGVVEYEVRFSAELASTATGGGTHFWNLIGWLSDRSDRARVGARWRWEAAQLFKTPKVIWWQIGPNGVERQDTEVLGIAPLQPDRWYAVRIAWRDGLSARVKVDLSIDGKTWAHQFENNPAWSAPRFIELPGHIDGKGHMSVRNLRISGLR